MNSILNVFLKRLTDISSNNRSICLLRLTNGLFFDLHRLDFLNKQPSFSLIQTLLSGKKKLDVVEVMNSRDASVNEISKSIRRMYRQQNILLEESGRKEVYIGWPFVKGKLLDGTLIRCPLLLFPVTIQLNQNQWTLERSGDSNVVFNKNFLLAYSHFNKTKVSDEWIEQALEELPTDSVAFRTELYALLKESPLELNFNQELFVDKLIDFKEYKKEAYSETCALGELKLYQEAVLGIFPQASSYLVPDYEYLIEQNNYAHVEQFFDSKKMDFEASSIREENSYYLFPVDGSQEEALLKVKEGESIVVQGPPGTGKSQLICNLITDFTARGKKVLLVSQKKAALEVVFNRLSSSGIGPFLALVHDFQNDRNELFGKIQTQIESIEKYTKQNQGYDTVQLERMYSQLSKQIRSCQGNLDDFKKALFSTNDFGIAPKELYLTSNPKSPTVSLKEYATRFNLETSISFERKIRNCMPYALRFMDTKYPWHTRVSFADFYHRDCTTIQDTLNKIPLYQNNICEAAIKKNKGFEAFISLEYLLEKQAATEQVQKLIVGEDAYFLLLKLLKVQVDADWLRERQKKIAKIFEKEKIENTLSGNELEEKEEILKRFIEATAGFFSKMKWHIFSEEKATVKKLMLDNKVAFTKEGAEEVLGRIASRKKLERERKALNKKNWIHSFPNSTDQAEIETWFAFYFKCMEAKELLTNDACLFKMVEDTNSDFKAFQELVQLIPLLGQDVRSTIKDWSKYISMEMIQEVLKQPQSVALLNEVLYRDFDLLIEFDKQRESFLAFEWSIVEALHGNELAVTVDEKVELFRNSLRLQWLDVLEEKYPSLRAASTLQLDQWESMLQEAIVEKRKVSAEIVAIKLREQCYRSIEFNRLHNRITYRDLLHQVTKKKKRWPLRKVVDQFNAELFDLLPCWMVSTESASALFAMDFSFDLVIFDEASQCYAEQGIPSMYRGKQVVIAGDSKQLQPTNIYQTRWEDEYEDIPELEIDSLLDLASNYLPSCRLTGHYRSKQLDLIDFSNRYFYNQSLALIPAFETINTAAPSIEYHLVKGVWENTVNMEEANEVVKLALKLVEGEKGKSIGIVTFNFKQAQLITDVLEEEASARKISLPSSLFVKNIENVQGDEKDIILFSIGYAPDAKGKFHMHFGSLNSEGGENRLNVAITRAREKVVVVASILPHQLAVEESLNEGPKVLKSYLEYAWDVSKGIYKPTFVDTAHQEKSWYLTTKLLDQKQMGEVNRAQELPFADLTVKRKQQYVSLILTDDSQYYSSRNAKDFHGYKLLELKAKGWKWERIFSREYWLNHEKKASFKEG